LNQREYCEAHGIPLKAFGNWRAKFKAEQQPPVRKLLYRRRGLSHSLSHMSYGGAEPIVPPARGGHQRKFSEADKRRILEEAVQPGASLSEVARRYGIAARVLFRWKQYLTQVVPLFVAVAHLADTPLGKSPAPRAVRDVELAALEHVRPVEPGKQFRLQEPHTAAGNARVEREARRHLAAIGEFGEHDFAIGDGERAGPVAVIGFRQRLALHCGEQIGDHDGRLFAHGRCGLGARMLMIKAVGSSLLAVGSFGLATATNYSLSGLVDWRVASEFIAGGSVGGLVGMMLVNRLSHGKDTLTRIFAVLIFVVAAYVLYRSGHTLLTASVI
jgi:transposase-like protein